MADINTVTVAGRLTRDSDLKYTPGGLAVLRCAIAVNSRRRDPSGEWVDEAHFFDATIFGKQAEALQNYLLKGRAVAITGELRQDRWESEGQTRSRVYILASNVMLIGSGSGENTAVRSTTVRNEETVKSTRGVSVSSQDKISAIEDDFEDDIPF